jgi:hypothetical protein
MITRDYNIGMITRDDNIALSHDFVKILKLLKQNIEKIS